MDADFALMMRSKSALAYFGQPEIFSTDKSSQYTMDAFANVLKEANVRISMDGKER